MIIAMARNALGVVGALIVIGILIPWAASANCESPFCLYTCDVGLLAPDCTAADAAHWPADERVRVGATCAGICCTAPPPFTCSPACSVRPANPAGQVFIGRAGAPADLLGLFDPVNLDCAGYSTVLEYDRTLEAGDYVVRYPDLDGVSNFVTRELPLAVEGASAPTPRPLPCSGDCDADGRVSIDELTLAVAAAVSSDPEPGCAAIDCHHSSCRPGPGGAATITIDCLVRAVVHALEGCPTEPCSVDADCDDRNDCTFDDCTADGCISSCACF